jgi:membrane protease YdiL (CAAX protease family)
LNIKTKGIFYYLLIAFGLAWVCWEIPLRLGLSLTSPFAQLAILPGAFAPAIASLVVRKWVTHEGFGDAGLKLHLRENRRWYLIALLLPLVVVGVLTLLAVVTGLGQPDFTFERAMQALVPGSAASIPLYLVFFIPFELLFTSIIAAPLLWGEEFGWRGYLQTRLFTGRPLLAAIATGLIWGVWHYPLNLRGYNFPGHPLLGLVVFPIGTVLVSIIFGWLFQRSGSIWVTSLAHAATNAFGGSLTFLLFYGGTDFLYVSYLGILGWLPLGALCLWLIASGQLKSKTAKGETELSHER